MKGRGKKKGGPEEGKEGKREGELSPTCLTGILTLIETSYYEISM